ncbi:hypothetical protein M404DRAFT_28335 [Pisolithus tinctorius Marx 270]|uniref:Uncharacterized protein n=1 Tax=Pisolithus tinctorius Marx 270 TaxID=870435 RepID=A0A0C3JWR1_PISTI|nr:hypothetical protein M404DRAFT_28335 [Pisolithus tinctorius Marx 270]
MSELRLSTAIDNNDKGRVVIDWTQVSDDAIRYDTDDEEETMRAKAKERKRRKVAEQAWWEEQAQLETERVAREQAEAKRAAQERAEAEAEEKKVCKEEEKREAEHKRKAGAGKGDEASTSGEARGEVKRVVMDPGCTCCARAQVICEFVVDSNKKRVACMRCNQSKGKCWWPGDGKEAKAGPKIKADKGKKRKADEETPEPGPSQKKQAKMSARPIEVLDLDETEAGGSGVKEAGTARYSGLEGKLDLFELHETVVENSGHIADTLESLLDESYRFGMAVSPSESGSSELDSEELHEEAEWLQTHSEDDEEESEGEDEAMAKTE